MKRFHLPKCPHCGKKISYPVAWKNKRQGEYICPKCGGICNITLDPLIYLTAFLAVIAGVAVFVLGILNTVNFSFLTPMLLILPFLLFFLTSPFFVRLKKPKNTNYPDKPENSQSGQMSDISAAAQDGKE